jgi:hypothetical protein
MVGLTKIINKKKLEMAKKGRRKKKSGVNIFHTQHFLL